MPASRRRGGRARRHRSRRDGTPALCIFCRRSRAPTQERDLRAEAEPAARRARSAQVGPRRGPRRGARGRVARAHARRRAAAACCCRRIGADQLAGSSTAGRRSHARLALSAPTRPRRSRRERRAGRSSSSARGGGLLLSRCAPRTGAHARRARRPPSGRRGRCRRLPRLRPRRGRTRALGAPRYEACTSVAAVGRAPAHARRRARVGDEHPARGLSAGVTAARSEARRSLRRGGPFGSRLVGRRLVEPGAAARDVAARRWRVAARPWSSRAPVGPRGGRHHRRRGCCRVRCRRRPARLAGAAGAMLAGLRPGLGPCRRRVPTTASTSGRARTSPRRRALSACGAAGCCPARGGGRFPLSP